MDERSKGDYLARGMGPFRPNERQTFKSYYEVPPEVLADPEALLSWAGEAIRAGQGSREAPRMNSTRSAPAQDGSTAGSGETAGTASTAGLPKPGRSGCPATGVSPRSVLRPRPWGPPEHASRSIMAFAPRRIASGGAIGP